MIYQRKYKKFENPVAIKLIWLNSSQNKKQFKVQFKRMDLQIMHINLFCLSLLHEHLWKNGSVDNRKFILSVLKLNATMYK